MTGENIMKIKSVSGITCYVRNLDKTAKFYEALGFDIKKRESDHIIAYSNWFWIDFLAIDKNTRADEYAKGMALDTKGAGVFFYLSVDDVDEFHKNLLANGLQPTTGPQNQPWGNREFILRDPDGYNLVIFKRK
jgi:catechol 2,3-dioxygenase-like lactoylglutathione lyase family enzyme